MYICTSISILDRFLRRIIFQFVDSNQQKKKKKKKKKNTGNTFHNRESSPPPWKFYLVEFSSPRFIRPSIFPLPSYNTIYSHIHPISSVIELAFAGDSGFIVVSNYVQSDVVSYILCRADVAFGIQQIQQ